MSDPLIEGYLQRAHEDIAAVEMLLRDGHVRIGLSRTYYAMFYTASALLASLGLRYAKHGAVIGAYGREFSKTGKLNPEFHKNLGRAFEFRNAADYEIASRLTMEDAERQLSRAREFLAAARQYLEAQSDE